MASKTKSAKKSVPAKPVKKPAPSKSKSAAKKAPAKKVAPKPAVKSAKSAKKPAPSKAKPAKKAPVKKAPVKKPAPKPAAKSAKKPTPSKSKPAAKKPVPAKKPASKPAPKSAAKKAVPAKKPASKPAPKPAAKKAVPAKKPAAKPAPKPAPKPAAKVPAKKPAPQPAKGGNAKTKPAAKPAPEPKAKPEKHVKVAPPISDLPVKGQSWRIEDFVAAHRYAKATFFGVVTESDERNNKKKFGTGDQKLPEKPTIAQRGKERRGEESQEEIYNRILQECRDEQKRTEHILEHQLCSKCGVNRVDRVMADLAYCNECYALLYPNEEAGDSDPDFPEGTAPGADDEDCSI